MVMNIRTPVLMRDPHSHRPRPEQPRKPLRDWSSPLTANTYVSNILRELDLPDLAPLVADRCDNGLIVPGESG